MIHALVCAINETLTFIFSYFSKILSFYFMYKNSEAKFASLIKTVGLQRLTPNKAYGSYPTLIQGFHQHFFLPVIRLRLFSSIPVLLILQAYGRTGLPSDT